MPTEAIHLAWREHIAIVTLDRPERRNAFNAAMWGALEETVETLKVRLPRAIVITGTGDRAFCAGFDVNPDNPQVASLIDAVQHHRREPVQALIDEIRHAVDGLVSLPVPVIAALNGLAFGGGAELALRCDMRIADPSVVISFSEVRLGLMPDWGGGVALTRLVGPARAAELILAARRIDAGEALRWGLVNQISAPGKSLDEALELADTIASHGPRAVRHALRVIRHSPGLPLERALDLESEEAVALITSGECYHGIVAFLEKKNPEFPDP